jgi:chloramphenicol 3-O-phosphotransferase
MKLNERSMDQSASMAQSGKHTPALFVITGISASGKTTAGMRLASEFDPSVFVEGDVIRRMICNGRVEMSPEPSATAMDQLRLRHLHTAMLAKSYLAHGYHVVVEDVILGDRLTEFLGMLEYRPLHLVVLAPSVRTVVERERGRQKDGYRTWAVEQLDAVLRKETPRLGLWLDTTGQSPDETVSEILTRRRDAELG